MESRLSPRNGGIKCVMRFLIAILFFALAAWFLVGSKSTSMPADLGGSGADPIDESLVDPISPRVPLADPPTSLIAGWQMECNHCHDLFESRFDKQRELQQHRHLVHDHGANDRCLNCHAHADRSKLVLHAGEMIDYTDSVRLCAKCHGPTWRDWEAGMHGRTMGSWDAASGEQVRLECVQCHDPHAPAFDPIAPLPGPNTLRMGTPPPPHAAAPDVPNPLELRGRHHEERSEAEPEHGSEEEGHE